MGKTIKDSEKEGIYNVYRRCLVECDADKALRSMDDFLDLFLYVVYKRVAVFTGKSVFAVRHIVEERHRSLGTAMTFGKTRQGREKVKLGDPCCVLIKKMKFLYSVRKAAPKLKILSAVVKDELGFRGGREKLRQILMASMSQDSYMEEPNITPQCEDVEIINETTDSP